MNSKKIGDNIYFQAYLACPVCYERGTNTGATYWEHYGCGGEMYLGDNANYHCNSCGKTCHVGKWKYGCPGHSTNNDEELDFQFASNAALASVISCAGQLTTAAGVPWLQKFLQNL